jgi:hypothetical protein
MKVKIEIICIILLTYLGFAFILNEINFQEWAQSERGLCVIWTIIITLLFSLKRIEL